MSETDLHAPTTPTPRKAESPKRYPCAVTGLERPRRDLERLDALRPSLAERIRADHPELAEDALIDRREINRYRSLYVEQLLRDEHGEFSELDRQVAESIANQQTIAENVEEDFLERRTLGQRLSDGLASFGGSWTFLTSFGLFLLVWMALNMVLGDSKSFDPYPSAQSGAVMSGGDPGADHHDEPKAARDEGPASLHERLPGQPQGRTGNPAPARKARPPGDQAVATAR